MGTIQQIGPMRIMMITMRKMVHSSLETVCLMMPLLPLPGLPCLTAPRPPATILARSSTWALSFQLLPLTTGALQTE